MIISTCNENEIVEAAMAAGASGYQVKPVTEEQIVPPVAAAMQRFSA